MNCARKHTLVTGCSSGIGRATALRLARAGQHVYAGVRKPADGDRLARSGAGEGGEITPVILDVTEPGHIAAVAAAIDEHTGPAGLDGLVNNAGYGLACPAEVVPLDAFRRQLDVNVTFSAMLRVMERREANGSPPDVAAATITRALTAPRPRAVYLCGKDSRRLAVLSGLPAPVLDLARRRIFRLPAPGSLAS
jgi:NAD(P)-dependent dehydrogenase (short-subunit alcohol dehydrogenase family)